MHALAITLIILKLLRVLNCSQQTHVDHVCHSGASTEQAGMGSGTLTFNGTLCELTITEIPEFQKENRKTIDQISRLNIVGVRRNESCDSSKIIINSKTYCIDESVKDTVINVTDRQMKFAVVSNQAGSFTLRYYRGERLQTFQIDPKTFLLWR